MTTHECLQAARQIDPDLSHIATKCSRIDRDGTIGDTYSLACCPGLDGTPCSLFHGDSFEECIEVYKAKRFPALPATPNNE